MPLQNSTITIMVHLCTTVPDVNFNWNRQQFMKKSFEEIINDIFEKYKLLLMK